MRLACASDDYIGYVFYTGTTLSTIILLMNFCLSAPFGTRMSQRVRNCNLYVVGYECGHLIRHVMGKMSTVTSLLRLLSLPSISNPMSRDSEASFSQSARNAIRGKYLFRCVICLNHISTAQCAHIIDAATPGQAQVCHKITTYDRVALVLLSFTTQSNSEFCLKIIRGMQREMAYFVSGGRHSL